MKTGENAIVERLRKSARASSPPSSGLRIGVGDDAALLTPRPGHETILTCDWFLEGTHFIPDKHPADAVGWKCLARAVSDIAAMGGRPRCYLLSLALPSEYTGRWLTQFLGGLLRASRRFGCTLAGGDTTVQGKVLINVTVVAEVRSRLSVLRSGARPGDIIYVSGRLGEAELGLRLLRDSKARADRKDPLLRKHLYPEPRLELGQWLADKRIATAMMDISDGLSTDLPRLCAASSVGARVEAATLPAVRLRRRSQAQSAGLDAAKLQPLKLALNGGDDYELLFTVSPDKATRLPQSLHGLPLTPIGQITRTRKLVLRDADGNVQPIIPYGWDPFRQKRQRRTVRPLPSMLRGS